MERYVAGFVAADGVERSSVFSSSSIGSFGDAILHLTAVNQGQGGAGAGHAANAEIAADHDGLMRLALEVGAKRWRRLCGNVRGQQVGWEIWSRGREASANCPAYAQSAEFQSMAAEFAALADAWDRASSIRTGQQQARREMQTGPMGIGQALANSGLPREQLERVAGRSRRPPEPQMIASIARRLEFDITTCHPSRQIFRPIALALAAASAYERRQELPASDTIQGVIARHAVSNMAAEGYETDAIANGFGQDWPLTTLASIDRQLTRPLSRLPKQVPDRAGAII
jgi:hypothetical protein